MIIADQIKNHNQLFIAFNEEIHNLLSTLIYKKEGAANVYGN